MAAMLVPVKQALIETPEYENLGANGLEKSILPVYSISELLAGIVSAGAAIHLAAMSKLMDKIICFILLNFR